MATHDQLEEKILDAALERILQVGIRRASLDDIARRAGINRVSIYRRFRVKEKLVDTTLQREIGRILEEVNRIVSAHRGIDAQIEESVLFVFTQTRTHPLVTQLLEVAPEEAVEFYTVRGEQMVSSGIRFIGDVLRRTQERGMIDEYDPLPVAELLARFAHSLLLTPAGGVDFENEEMSREFIRATIVPMIKHGLQVSP